MRAEIWDLRQICKHTKLSWSSWSARVALQLSGRYEPYRLICRWLNVKRPGRCAPWGAQGVDTAYGNSYKGQTFRLKNSEHLHAFPYPNIQNSTFPHQPKAGGPSSLSREGNVQHAFHLQSF